MSTRCARSAIGGAAAIGNRATATDRAITDGIIVRTSTPAIITGTVITADIMVAAITAADITADTGANRQRGGFGPLTFLY